MTPPGQPPTLVLLCRGCCCGTAGKHPGVDHQAQVEALTTAAGDQPAVGLRVVDCLDECDRSNVAVIRQAGRPARGGDTWLGGLLSERATAALAEWIRAGGSGPLPPALAGLRFRHHPPRRNRRR